MKNEAFDLVNISLNILINIPILMKIKSEFCFKIGNN